MTNYFRDVWPKVVARRYESGGHMVALQEMDIEVNEELVRIPKGHKLSRDEALCYPGDVMHVFKKGESAGMGWPLVNGPHPSPLPQGEGE